MDKQNIIAIKNSNSKPEFAEFERLMKLTEDEMNNIARNDCSKYASISSSQLEDVSVEIIKSQCKYTAFNPDNVHLISGQRFPDIIAEDYYGVEVKSTTGTTWQSTGSSIVESTRIKSVERIYMLFGKLGGEIPEFRCKPYEDVLYDITVTHSPRYLINMDITPEQTIFKKMGTTYDELRTSKDSINRVRQYYRNIAIKGNKKEMPWWLTSDNIEHTGHMNIKLWSTLDIEEKKRLTSLILILFPETMKSKYTDAALWLCSYAQVVNHCMRDLYSAGGKITMVNDSVCPRPFKHLYATIVELSSIVKSILDNPSVDELELLKEFKNDLYLSKHRYETWLNNYIIPICKNDNVPIKDWIENNVKFVFS